MEKKITKNISYICNLLIAQGLWQAYYQILSIILLKEFIKFNANTDPCGINISIATVFLNTQILKMI